ncbi:MAG TPA: hypothetical protein VIE65_07330 [Methylobacter sp.]
MTPGAGFATVGTAGSAVTVDNGNNSGVASWQINLVGVGPGSLLVPTTPYAFSDNGNTPIASFTPDVPGSYRLVLKVWGSINRIGNPTDVDIRNFLIQSPNGLFIFPYQKDPDPLPTLASGLAGAKPNELNVNGLEFGWSGNGLNDGFLNQAIPAIGAFNIVSHLFSDGFNNDVVLGGNPGFTAHVVRGFTNPSPASTVQISGISSNFAAGLWPSIYKKSLINTGINPFILLNENVGSSVVNRFRIAGGDLAVEPNESVDIFYDISDSRWRII